MEDGDVIQSRLSKLAFVGNREMFGVMNVAQYVQRMQYFGKRAFSENCFAEELVYATKMSPQHAPNGMQLQQGYDPLMSMLDEKKTHRAQAQT